MEKSRCSQELIYLEQKNLFAGKVLQQQQQQREKAWHFPAPDMTQADRQFSGSQHLSI